MSIAILACLLLAGSLSSLAAAGRNAIPVYWAGPSHQPVTVQRPDGTGRGLGEVPGTSERAESGEDHTLYSWMVFWREDMPPSEIKAACEDVEAWPAETRGFCMMAAPEPLRISTLAITEAGLERFADRYRPHIEFVEQDRVVHVAGGSTSASPMELPFHFFTRPVGERGVPNSVAPGRRDVLGQAWEGPQDAGSVQRRRSDSGDGPGAPGPGPGSVGVEAATPAPTPTPTPASGTLTRPTDILTNNTNVWGIDRIDQVNLPLNDKIVERSTGSGVRVYVLDTGVREDHVEFLNEAGTRRRITELYCMSTDSNSCEDYNEHGTHVSGTALGLNVGVAPAAELYVVKTMSADGTGPLSIIIDAMAHIYSTHPAQTPGVLNMSIAITGTISVEHYMINLMASQGILAVVAAGNDNVDACTGVYPKVRRAVAVAASDITDAMASFSDWGPCVDLFGPGVDIYSACGSPTLCTSNNEYLRLSGTSMATPHVTGTAALFFAHSKDVSPDALAQMITLAGVPKVTGHNQYAGPGQSFTNILVNIQHLDHRVFKARMTDSGGNTVGFPYTNIPVDQSTNYTIYISIDPTSGSSGPSQAVSVSVNVTDSTRYSVSPSKLTFTTTNHTTPQTVTVTVDPNSVPTTELEYVTFLATSSDTVYNGAPFAVALLDQRQPVGDTAANPIIVAATQVNSNDPFTINTEVSDLNFTFSGLQTCAATSQIFPTEDASDFPRGPDV